MHLTSRGFPLFLTFDLDAETMWTTRDPSYAARPILMSQGAYGWKVGTGRILNLTPDEEREEMERGIEAIEKASGRKPRGWRSAAAEISPVTMPMLVEYGFDYSSNFFDDDSPYIHTVEGKKTRLVELPFRWVLDDAPFFQYSIVLPGRTLQAPSAVLETWKAEFDLLHAENRMMMVGMHPQLIGQPSRIKVLEGLIEHALDRGDVWIGRCDEIVDDMRPVLEGLGR